VADSLNRRLTFVALAIGTIALGLGVHFTDGVLPPAVRDILGDALWAAMIAWWMAAVAPAVRLSLRSAVALAFCAAVEFSQLYHAPALDALRETTIGQLTLGSGFDSRDLVAYAAGVVAAALLERVALGRVS